MTEITTRKVSGSAVVLTTYTPTVTARKVSGSAVVLTAPDSGVVTRKVSGSAVVHPDITGDALQVVAGYRPTYRASPDPFIEFGTGDALRVTLLIGGTYTQILYRADDSFDVQVLTLPAGIYTLPATSFNQLALIPATLSTIALASIQRSMRVRAGNA